MKPIWLAVVGVFLLLAAIASGTAGPVEVILFWAGIGLVVWSAFRGRRSQP